MHPFDDPALFQRDFLHCYAGLLVFFHREAKLCGLLLETKPMWFVSRNLVPELPPKRNCEVVSLFTTSPTHLTVLFSGM